MGEAYMTKSVLKECASRHMVESKPNECEKVKDTTRSEGDAMIRIMRDIGIKSWCVNKLIDIHWAEVIKRPNKVARIWSHLTCMQ